MTEYKSIYYETNPWAIGEGDYQDILGTDNEPTLIVYTPDIERYCNTEAEAKQIIDDWIAENGTYEEYTFKADMKLGLNRLTIIN